MSHTSSSVAMVSGLHPAKMNCTRIFNLFCLYGNIEKVAQSSDSSVDFSHVLDFGFTLDYIFLFYF